MTDERGLRVTAGRPVDAGRGHRLRRAARRRRHLPGGRRASRRAIDRRVPPAGRAPPRAAAHARVALARPALQPHPGGRGQGAAGRPQGRRAGLGRGAHATRWSQALDRQGQGQDRPRRRGRASRPTTCCWRRASKAIIVGFNVRPERNAAELAEKEGVDIRLHTVIYELTDELKKAMTGLLEPTFERGQPRPRRGARHLQGSQGRHHRRLPRGRGRHPAQRQGPPAARQPRGLRGADLLAAAIQGRRLRGAQPASTAASGSSASRTSSRATSSRPTSGRGGGDAVRAPLPARDGGPARRHAVGGEAAHGRRDLRVRAARPRSAQPQGEARW